MSAGTPFTVVDKSGKEQLVKDFAVLLGDFWDDDAFPLKGGRLFIAGKQTGYCKCMQPPPDQPM